MWLDITLLPRHPSSVLRLRDYNAIQEFNFMFLSWSERRATITVVFSVIALG